MLTKPTPAYVLIIRATHDKGRQREALREMWRRGLWLHDGTNGGDDQEAAAIALAGYPVPAVDHRASILEEIGYGPVR
jgi:hypothetical protein